MDSSHIYSPLFWVGTGTIRVQAMMELAI